MAGRVLDFHLANAGRSRFYKFEWAFREVLQQELTEQESARLGEAFSRLTQDAVVAAPLVPGSHSAMEANAVAGVPQFVVSGTPQDEMRVICGIYSENWCHRSL